MKLTIKIFFLFSCFLSLFSAFAQAPEKMSYQAVIRNASNTLITNQAVGMRVSILQGSATGTEVYKELFNPNPQTNINGLVTVEIGSGIPLTGTFAGINWANGPFFIKTETDPTGGTSYTIVGTSQLLSSPYALYAKKSGDAGWGLNGNTVTSSNFIGTTNDTDLFFKRNNVNAGKISENNTSIGFNALNPTSSGDSNTAIGVQSMFSNTGGYRNTATGFGSLRSNTTGFENTSIGYASLYNNITGNLNTSVGSNALNSNTIGSENSAFGNSSLSSNTSGNLNTASGRSALASNTTGSRNVANGSRALYSNTYGFNNTAIGVFTLEFNTSGDNNTAVGFESLKTNITGYHNTASGYQSLYSNTSGYRNTAFGYQSLYSNNGLYNVAIGYESLKLNTSGYSNTAIGYNSMYSNVDGRFNTAIGLSALYNNVNGFDNVATGIQSLFNNISGDKNTANGRESLSLLTTGNNNIGIGYLANVPTATGSNQVRIGNTAITYAGTQVAWSVTSDRRWKENIQPSNLGLNFINDLKPVFYTRKNDETKKVEYGIIAQELEASLEKFGANTNGIITKDDEGMYSVRYNDLLAPMIKAIQEQQAMIEELKAEIQTLKNKK
jgi:trimeric autotransporter adhesin